MQEIKITYDGKVYVSKHCFKLGEFDIANIVHATLGFNENDYQDINAEVIVTINRKPDVPKITITGGNDDADI